ncbi:hypothetical protein DACRYDRAFT_45638 [Dacryopinax primogenitus]|uniref:Uncharacterized protein n=1 Tax=Dacryopinax primogenitus (strain DJM 731) TaxID=1858805 RepID=M5GEK1_DACPD|nr:uncharacterized protein DACRYDRAFT_45638 [Dacryopinax primogenitus]EJU05487.1 hypothetical protein DACRYDRAFT_45638 [Dacryopinax primogenitus]
MPAVAKLMNMKGHNGLLPCRMCKITAVHSPEERGSYVPLNRARFPLQEGQQPSHNPLNLSLYEHASMLHKAKQVSNAASNAELNCLARDSGMKGVSIWRHLGSIVWPTSFPLDFMHLIFKNIAPLLLKLWMGKHPLCKEDAGFVIPANIWSAIALQVGESGATIPGAFGCRVPHLLLKQHEFTAEAWMLWLTQLAPVVMSGRFEGRAYYTHLVKLSHCVTQCLSFSHPPGFVDNLCKALAEWVVEYEQLYS